MRARIGEVRLADHSPPAGPEPADSPGRLFVEEPVGRRAVRGFSPIRGGFLRERGSRFGRLGRCGPQREQLHDPVVEHPVPVDDLDDGPGLAIAQRVGVQVISVGQPPRPGAMTRDSSGGRPAETALKNGKWPAGQCLAGKQQRRRPGIQFRRPPAATELCGSPAGRLSCSRGPSAGRPPEEIAVSAAGLGGGPRLDGEARKALVQHVEAHHDLRAVDAPSSTATALNLTRYVPGARTSYLVCGIRVPIVAFSFVLGLGVETFEVSENLKGLCLQVEFLQDALLPGLEPRPIIAFSMGRIWFMLACFSR
jgi:hypothetical protein